jgi:transposase
VFAGNTGDPATLSAQVHTLKQRFRLDHVVLVGDRGMITEARLREDIKPAGLDWITALRAPAIQALVAGGRLQLTLFDQRNMAAITSPDFPGERLIVCRNPDLAAERRRKRSELLEATERQLARIQAAVARMRDPLHGTAVIALKVGAVLDQHKMAKHFELDIADASFRFTRKLDAIDAEAATDGLYVIRTSLDAACLDDADTVRSYKSLALVERAFRCLKSVTCRSTRSATGYPSASVRMSSSACSLTISNGTCGSVSRRCSTTTPTSSLPRHSAPAPSPRPSARPPPSPNRPPGGPPTAYRCTVGTA